ncbi:MAG: 50S ribosomal protein L10, partial [Raoultibacter sp.]
MPNVQNKESLVKIKESLENVGAVWVVDYRGLTVKAIQALRNDMRGAEADMKVYKNTL